MPHSKYLPERMGSAVVEPSGAVEAGSYRSFTLTYTAGFFVRTASTTRMLVGFLRPPRGNSC